MGAEERDQNNLSGGLVLDSLPSYVAAAHELKSPLVLVRQLSLALDDNSISDEDRKRILRQITLTSEKALRLTTDLTKSIRMRDALFELEPINPQQLCEDVVKEMSPYFRENDREIRLVGGRQSLLLVGNRDLLRRVIMNFSDNALNYADQYSTIEIKMQTRDHGKTVRLGVRDYGPAVPADTIKSISKRLLNKTLDHARPQSSGLGLYIANQFAGAMNGKIGVTKHIDGATFYIDLQASKQLSLL